MFASFFARDFLDERDEIHHCVNARILCLVVLATQKSVSRAERPLSYPMNTQANNSTYSHLAAALRGTWAGESCSMLVGGCSPKFSLQVRPSTIDPEDLP